MSYFGKCYFGNSKGYIKGRGAGPKTNMKHATSIPKNKRSLDESALAALLDKAVARSSAEGLGMVHAPALEEEGFLCFARGGKVCTIFAFKEGPVNLYTSGSADRSSNMEPLNQDPKLKLAIESLCFGYTKTAVELRGLKELVEKLRSGAASVFEEHIHLSSAFEKPPKKEEYRKLLEEWRGASSPEEVACGFLKERMTANLDKPFKTLVKELEEKKAKYAGDAAHGQMELLREDAASGFLEMPAEEFLEKVYRPSRERFMGLAPLMHPMLSKKVLSSATLWSVMGAWERDHFNVVLVGWMRYYLLLEAPELAATFWAFNAFSKQSEMSASFEGQNSVNAWAHVLPVAKKEQGALCGCLKDPGQLVMAVQLVVKSEDKKLAEANDYTIKLLKEFVLGKRLLTPEQTDRLDKAKALMRELGLDQVLFAGETSPRNFLAPREREFPEEAKGAISLMVDAETCIEFVDSFHSFLPSGALE